VERISAARPHDQILTEETGTHGADGDWLWIIDPLDGTTNYAHGFPHYAVSIGVMHAGHAEIGVIYDPMKDELFHALRGEGAFRDGQPIHVSATTEIGQSLLTTGFAYDVHETLEDDNLGHFREFVKTAQGVRRTGSAALDLAYVACGRFDGFWELSLHRWDVAAGLLLIGEAGGCCTNFTGGTVPQAGDELLASNTRLHQAMIEVLARIALPSAPID